MTRPHGSISRGLILLRRSNGSRVLDRPRDMPGYEGRGASTALLLAIDRAVAAQGSRTPGKRAITLHEMALEQVEREQMRGSEAAE